MNTVTLIGRTTKDMDLRYTTTGKAVANFTLAVRREYTDAEGRYQSDFINCVAWGKQAETLAQYVKKGHRLGVTGRIATRSYKTDNGQTIYVTEVVVDGFDFLEPKRTPQHVTEVVPEPQEEMTTPETLLNDQAFNPFDALAQDINNTNLPF